GKGFIGVIANLFKVDEKYVKAIEISLGSSIQNIAVEDESCAKVMIQFLKDNKKGRATFLPVSIVSGKEIALPNRNKKYNGMIDLASNLIEYDKRLKGL